MIKSERQFKAEMRKMVRRVSNGEKYYTGAAPTRDENEVLVECQKQGYLLSMARDGNRTMDGAPHPTLNTEVVPLKGLAFLNPDKTERRSVVSFWLSIIALVISVLSNLPSIIQSIASIIHHFM